MTLEQKLGQLIMFGFSGTELDEKSIELIRKYKIGNVILFTRNLRSPEQMKALCDDIQKHIVQECGIKAFIGIDQEGGVVSRMPPGTVIFPSAMAMTAAGSSHDAQTAAYYSARELAALGVNCNFAPVLDVNTNPQNPVIGVRSYGNNVQQVIEYSCAVQKGIIQAGVLPSIKHFPGHGDTEVDSHLGLPVVDKTREELFACELAPFAEAIKQNAPCVMVSHMLFPAFDNSGMPASLSEPIMQDLLRNHMGFNGLIISDCLEMGAITDHFGTANAFVTGIKAGLDIGCISHTATLVEEAIQQAYKAVQDGSLPVERIENALHHVLKAKEQFANASAPIEVVNCREHRKKAEEIMQKSITRFDDNPNIPPVNSETFFISTPIYRATLASSESDERTFSRVMAEKFNAHYAIVPAKPNKQDIAQAVQKTHTGQTVVVGTYNAHLNTEQIDLVQSLYEAKRTVIAVALRNPYDLNLMPKDIIKLCAYEYSMRSFNATEKILRGEKAQGNKDHI